MSLLSKAYVLWQNRQHIGKQVNAYCQEVIVLWKKKILQGERAIIFLSVKMMFEQRAE